jgi:hypothetical protein
MNALAHSYLFWIVVILGLLGLYILPSVIATIRRVEGLGWIIVINLLPTGVGWFAALIGALMLPRREPSAMQSLYAMRSYPAVYIQERQAWPESRHQGKELIRLPPLQCLPPPRCGVRRLRRRD